MAAGVSTGYVLIESYWWFLALQPVLGIARNVGWVASQSYITSLAGPQERSTFTGRFSFFGSIGQMAGPVLVGGAAQLVGFRWAFLFVAGYATVFSVIGLLLAEITTEDHETTRAKQGSGLRSAWDLMIIRGIQVALLLTFVRLWTNSVFTTFYPIYLVDTGLEPGVVGTVMATPGLIATVSAPTAGFWTRRLPPEAVAGLALGCGAVALLLAPHLATMPVVYLVPLLIGIGGGLSLPVLMSIVTGAAPAEKRGVALGMRGMINQTAATVAPVVMGPLVAGVGMILGFGIGGVIGAGVLIAAHWLHGHDEVHKGKQ